MTFNAAFSSILLLVLISCGSGYELLLGPKEEVDNAEHSSSGMSESATGSAFLEVDREKTQPAPVSYIVVRQEVATPQSNAPSNRPGFESYSLRSSFKKQWYQVLEKFERVSARYKNLRYLGNFSLPQREGRNQISRLMQFSGANLMEPYAHGIAVAEMNFSDHSTAIKTLDSMQSRGEIWYYEPNHVSKPAVALSDFFTEYISSDGIIASSWWHKRINLDRAYQILLDKAQNDPEWEQTLLENPPVIAVLDSGVDYEHPSLIDRVLQNSNQNATGCSGDHHGCNTTITLKGYLGNGDVHPYQTNGPGQSCLGFGGFSLSSIQPAADEYSEIATVAKPNPGICGHGTHVSGLIAGEANAENQVGGVCPFCKVLPIKVVSSELDGKIPDSAIIAGLKYISLFRRGQQPLTKIINMSFGKYTRSRTVSLLIRILKSEGILMIAASGNENSIKRTYPSGYEDAVAVSAVDESLNRAAYSNYGRWVDISAPGGSINDIYSSFPGGGFLGQNGTSQASPIAAGVAALYLALNPNASPSEVRNALVLNADSSLYDPATGGGLNDNFIKNADGERQPLLGSGLLNAEATMLGTGGGVIDPTVPDRVKKSCGSITRVNPDFSTGEKSNLLSGSGMIEVILIFLLPALIGLIHRLRIN